MALVRQNIGWTDLTASSDFVPHSDENSIVETVEDAFAMTADSPSDLPGSGNWEGRHIFVLGVGDYAYTGGAWKSSPVTRYYSTPYSGSNIGGGTTMATFSIPAIPVDALLEIEFLGQAGFESAAVGVRPVFASTAGTLSSPSVNQMLAPASQFTDVSLAAELTLPAGTATTITVKTDSSAVAYWRGISKIRVHLVGEY